MASATVEWDDGGIRAKLQNFDRDLDNAVDKLFDYEAAYATGYIKAKAPWTDRTGAARTGLIAVANNLGGGNHELLMSYSVYYGIWLEVANNGKYAVITPAMRIIGEKILSDMNGLLERMG